MTTWQKVLVYLGLRQGDPEMPVELSRAGRTEPTTCRICGSLVPASAQQRHTRWHESLDRRRP